MSKTLPKTIIYKSHLMCHKTPYRIPSIREFHRLRNLPAPAHPLISVVDYALIKPIEEDARYNWIHEFYSISLKRTTNAKLKYGQKLYDFDEGVLVFMAPQQVLSIDTPQTQPAQHTGWLLLIHPDFLWKTSLAQKINRYPFFDYAVNEALFLSPNEETTINQLILLIKQEYQADIDDFSQQIISSQIETLLHYADRFYHRQFITRKKNNDEILAQLENILNTHFGADNTMETGLPRVQQIAAELHLSTSYLSGLLKSLTGQTTQQHIHYKLIERAKELLSTTELSVSEIAYNLGFEHSQSFSKFFKNTTSQTPLEFRRAFY